MADVDEFAGVRVGRAGQEAGHRRQRFLRGGQSDADRPRAAQGVQPFQREGQVTAPLVARQGVDLVHDHAAHAGEHAAPAVRAQQHVQRLGRRHQDMGRALAHRLPGLWLGVAGAHGGADAGIGQAQAFQFRGDAFEWRLQVQADVVGQRFERRDIYHHGGVRQRAAGVHAHPHQFVDGGQEGSQCLAGTGGGRHERRAAAADGRPGAALGLGRRAEGPAEPRGHGRMEAVQRVDGVAGDGHARLYGAGSAHRNHAPIT